MQRYSAAPYDLTMADVLTEARSPQWRRAMASFSLIQRVLFGLIALNLLVIGFGAWSLYQSRLKYDASAALETRNLAHLLDQGIATSLHAIDLVLETLVAQVEQPSRNGPSNEAELAYFIKRLESTMPDLTGLRIASAEGRLRLGTGVQPSAMVSIADRDYFLKLKQNPEMGLVVSQPVLGRIVGVWVINLARATRAPNGDFSGVVVASIPLSRFTRDYAALATGLNDTFTLFDREQRIIVRSLNGQTDEAVIGRQFNIPAQKALLSSGKTEGSYKSISVVDGVERVFFFRQIEDFPLSLSVGRATHDYLAAWRSELVNTAGLILLFILSTGGLFGFIHRAWRLQAAANAALTQANQTLLVEQKFSEAVFESSPFAMYVRDHKGLVKHWNAAAEALFGWREEEVLGKKLLTVPANKIKESEDLRLRVLNGESILQYETQRLKRDGSPIDLSATFTPLRLPSGEIEGFLTIAIDVSERKASEQQIEFLAYRDVLTGLPNRLLLLDRFYQAVAQADRSGTQVALLFLDLDSFKTINDSLGHVVGDAMLKSVAQRLMQCVGESGTLSRQGGDEFMVLMPDLQGTNAITPVLRMIREKLKTVFIVEGQELSTTASIGVAIYPTDGKDFDTLLKKADTAMYRAKEGGSDHYRFFDEQMNVDAVEHLRVKNGMRQALDRHELALYYQPQIDLRSGAVIGVEALIRWNDPVHGMVAPAKFMPITEASELIVPIGEWVIQEACRQAMIWRKTGFPPLVMAVNISAVQFRRGDVEKAVTHALQVSGLEPRYLELELTESVLIHDTELVLRTVQRLKRLGVTLSIDDFGTGYSSLSYLKRFEVDKLKIDQSFIRDLTTNPDDVAITRAIIEMAKSLNLKTIAEGVETDQTMARLQQYGCDEAQGYHFAAPMSAQVFADFLATRSVRGTGHFVEKSLI